MELRHLRYFVAVAEELHFTRAAERLHIGQPPLSQQIQALEDELGAPLFLRSKRRVQLTEAGQILLQRARRILAEAAEAGDEVRRAARGELGELRVGFTSSLPLTPLLTRLLRAYREAAPDVTLRLMERFTAVQFEALRHSRLDVGFVRYNGALESEPGLRLRLLRRDPLLMVLPVGHALAARASVSLKDFRDEGFIMYPENAGAGLARVTRELCVAAGYTPRVVQEADEAVTQIGLVAAGLGVTVMPAPMACVAVDRVRYLPLRDARAWHSMVLVTRDEAPGPVLSRFLDLLDQVLGEEGEPAGPANPNPGSHA